MTVARSRRETHRISLTRDEIVTAIWALEALADAVDIDDQEAELMERLRLSLDRIDALRARRT